jgi:hypothetical protein
MNETDWLRLPEKSYFTIEDLAKRWDVTRSYVEHVIEIGDLCLAIPGFKLPITIQAKYEYEGALPTPEEANKNRHASSPEIYELPDYLYLPLSAAEDNIIPKPGVSTVGISKFSYSQEDSSDFFLVDEMGNAITFYAAPNDIVILKSERDRFEEMHAITTDQFGGAQSTPNYSTAYLQIMEKAINEFFCPRRNPDAKKHEVVEWIKSEMAKAELGDSENIAKTMFTIIKPPDHNPRKRRG